MIIPLLCKSIPETALSPLMLKEMILQSFRADRDRASSHKYLDFFKSSDPPIKHTDVVQTYILRVNAIFIMYLVY